MGHFENKSNVVMKAATLRKGHRTQNQPRSVSLPVAAKTHCAEPIPELERPALISVVILDEKLLEPSDLLD